MWASEAGKAYKGGVWCGQIAAEEAPPRSRRRVLWCGKYFVTDGFVKVMKAFRGSSTIVWRRRVTQWPAEYCSPYSHLSPVRMPSRVLHQY